MPGARVIQGCALSEKALVIWIEFPEPPKRQTGDIIGIDVGINKLLVTSENEIIGDDWKTVSAKVRRRLAAKPSGAPGSRATAMSTARSNGCRGTVFKPSGSKT